MGSGKRCRDCDSYEKRGHNYCRMCGHYLKKGIVHHVRIATVYNTNEKYCGYCGGQKHNCNCR